MHWALASVAAVIFACGLAHATTTFAAPAAAQDNGGNTQPSGDRTVCKTACDKKY